MAPNATSHVDLAVRADRDLAAEASELLPDGFIAVLEDETIDYVNERAAIICGIPADELAGMHVGEGLALQDMCGNDWWEKSAPARRLRISKGHREKMLMLPNGRFVLLTARYLRHPDGTFFAALLGLRDAAERMRAERQMAELITTVAHELRSPIASITGFTGSLLRHWERFADDDKMIMLRTVQEDAERVSRLITDLLDVSRIEARSVTVRPRRIDLAAVFEAHVTRHVAAGQARDRFHIEVTDGLPQLWADADRLERILTNLVDNALRHGSGQVCLRATAAELEGAPAVRICVCDEGPGIPPEDQELVFSRYWQGGSKTGSGLGLFLVRGLTEAHGGVVELNSVDCCGGTRVEVVLPAGPPALLA